MNQTIESSQPIIRAAKKERPRRVFRAIPMDRRDLRTGRSPIFCIQIMHGYLRVTRGYAGNLANKGERKTRTTSSSTAILRSCALLDYFVVD